MTARAHVGIALATAIVFPLHALTGQTSVTADWNGRVLVREQVVKQLAPGVTEVEVSLGEFDPTSLTVTTPGVTLQSAVVARSDSSQTGRVLLGIEAATAVAGFELSYMTRGVQWGAVYDVLVTGGRATIAPFAYITVSDKTRRNVELILAAGTSYRNSAWYGYSDYRQGGGNEARLVLPAPSKLPVAFDEERLGDQFLYRLREPVTLERGSVLVLPLAPAQAVQTDRVISLEGSVPPAGMLGGYLPNWVRVRGKGQLVLRRAHGPLAETALPAGMWRLYEVDQGGRRQFMSETSLQRIPAGAPIVVPSDSAPPVYAHRRTIDYKDERDSTVAYSSLSIKAVMVTVEYRIFNEGDSTAATEIVESRDLPWTILSSTVPFAPPPPGRVRFEKRVAAHDSADVRYRIRVPSVFGQ